MKNKKNARKEIEEFFNKKELDSKDVKKIKRLAMRHHIRLKGYRKRFCKDCLKDLKNGEVRITKFYKSIKCSCGQINRWKIE